MLTVSDVRKMVEPILAVRGGNPRVHPNGFIQLDLEPVPDSWHASHQRGHSGASRRLHIWNPPGIELPHQETINEVHDHVFDMRSTVVRGTLTQRLYSFRVGMSGMGKGLGSSRVKPTHELYRAVYARNSDSRLEATGIRGSLREDDAFQIEAGDVYFQPAFTFHDSDPVDNKTVVTVMTKEKIHEGDASVICFIDVPPDNSFDRASAAPASVIYDAIVRSLA